MSWRAVFTICVLIATYGQFGFCQKVTPSPKHKNEEPANGCESRVKCPCTGGMPGIPGMPGMPGPYGARGDKGDSGSRGERGPTGIMGTPGPRGPSGEKGGRGSRGQTGTPGKTGPSGAKGDRGGPGTKGDAGEKGDAGPKGDAAAGAPIPATYWRQCVWKNINDVKDSGKIKECSFNKLQSSTALKVSFQGVLRVIGDARCNRWYFKFNGNECSGPMTIEAVVYNDWSSGNPNLLHHRSFEGYCENLPRGAINVELWVGSCPSGHGQGDAYTGWQSVSRIIVEEVTAPQ